MSISMLLHIYVAITVVQFVDWLIHYPDRANLLNEKKHYEHERKLYLSNSTAQMDSLRLARDRILWLESQLGAKK